MNLVSTGSAASNGVGPLLKDWRSRRRFSQLELAMDVGVSTRHLSFIETGRSKPSPAMLEAIAERLEVPLRERNRMLLAAGYAPRFSERKLDDSDLLHVHQSLARLLRAHEPYPGLVLDRQWDVVLANEPAAALTAFLPDFLKMPSLNIFRASLHPEGLSSITENFDEWARYLLRTLRRSLLLDASPELAALEEEVTGYPTVSALSPGARISTDRDSGFLVPFVLNLPQGRVSMFTTLTTFGTARDVTLDELCIELFYPADAASERLLRA